MKDDTLNDVHPERLREVSPKNDNVVSFKKPEVVTPEVTPSNPAVIQLLEDYLDLAKQGKISFVALAALDNNNVGVSTWEPEGIPPERTTAAIGTVSFLNHRFNDTCLDGAVYADKI